VGGATNVYVRARSGSRYGSPEGKEGNSIAAQKVNQRLTLRSIRMERNIHGISVIQPPTIVDRALAKNRDRQRFVEGVLEEALNFP